MSVFSRPYFHDGKQLSLEIAQGRAEEDREGPARVGGEGEN